MSNPRSRGWPQSVYYPPAAQRPVWVSDLVAAVAAMRGLIDSSARRLTSDAVLRHLKPGLTALGYSVRGGSRSTEWLCRRALGSPERPRVAYAVDAVHDALGIVVGVPAGRTIDDAVYRDLVRAALLLDARFFALGVPVSHVVTSGGQEIDVQSLSEARLLLDLVYANGRLLLPFEGVLLFGY